MMNSDPNRLQSASELVLLIQLLERINTGIESIKGSQQSNNSTNALIIEQLIGIRTELKEWMTENLEMRTWRNDLEIQALESKDNEYAIEIEKITKAQADIHAAMEALRSGRGHTQEKMKAIVEDALSKDKVDIRGVKVSSRQFNYLLIGVIILLALLIVVLPDSVAQILMRLAGMIGGQPPP